MTGTVVVYASAAVVLLIDPGPAGAQYRGAARRCPVVAAAHLPYEVKTILRWHRTRVVCDDEARLALDGLHALPIDLWSYAVLADRIWSLGANLSA